MFSTFHFAKVVLHLRSFPLTWHLSHADWSGTAGWRPCLRGAHPWQKGSGHPLLVSAMTQVHAQERASGPSCWLMWVALEQSESGPPGSFRPSFWHFSRRSMSLSALPSSRQISHDKGLLEVQYTHAYTTWTDRHCLISSWEMRTNSLYLSFLILTQTARKPL